MFGFFASQHRKTRRLAADWLEMADKIYAYRRDVLPAADLETLVAATADLRRLVREKADIAKLKLGIDALEPVLRRTGGHHYPKSTLVDYVEFFLVAAIVILGLRAFYVQPFKIPTNSMWPSYNGMTAEVFLTESSEPSPMLRGLRLATLGASPRRVNAPAAGEILLPLGNGPRGIIAYREVPGKSWGVLPAKQREYQLLVGGRPVSVRVPLDFDMDWTLRDAFFPGDPRSLAEIVATDNAAGELYQTQVNTAVGPQRLTFLRTGRSVVADERVLSFDILTGDQLFVDRVSYHFVRPKVGDGFVFRTGNIPALARNGGDQYYIKRLVGLPGDKLRIADYTLYRNGAPITGSPAFDKNARRVDRYVGYRREGDFRGDGVVTVEPDRYLALGDNSANSYDGRYWGTIPAKDVVGRPLFIYYPFTRRWGPAP